jgi:hypothetical protein
MLLSLAPALILVGATATQEPQAEPDAFEAVLPSEPAALEAEAPADQESEVQALSARQGRLESLYEGALIGAKDAEDFTETPGYRRLLEILARYSEEDLRARAGRRLDVAAALADPDAWRGEIVRVRALIVQRRAVRLARPLGEHVDTFRAFLTEADGTEGVVVDFLEPPPPLEPKEDVVEVEGVFFRTVRYENKKGEYVEAPYLIARGLRRLDTEQAPRSTGFDQLAKILIALAVAFLVIRILFTMKKSPMGRRRPDPSAALASRGLEDRARAPTPKP